MQICLVQASPPAHCDTVVGHKGGTGVLEIPVEMEGKGWGTGTPSQISVSFISVGWTYNLSFGVSKTCWEESILDTEIISMVEKG